MAAIETNVVGTCDARADVGSPANPEPAGCSERHSQLLLPLAEWTVQPDHQFRHLRIHEINEFCRTNSCRDHVTCVIRYGATARLWCNQQEAFAWHSHASISTSHTHHSWHQVQPMTRSSVPSIAHSHDKWMNYIVDLALLSRALPSAADTTMRSRTRGVLPRGTQLCIGRYEMVDVSDTHLADIYVRQKHDQRVAMEIQPSNPQPLLEPVSHGFGHCNIQMAQPRQQAV